MPDQPPLTSLQIRRMRRLRKHNRTLTMAERHARKKEIAERQYQEKLAKEINEMF